MNVGCFYFIERVDNLKLEVTEDLFKDFYPLIVDDDITDIKWNGKALWINHLKKGRYPLEEFHVEEDFLDILTTKIANSMNVNFNTSNKSMMAETDELRIHVVHRSVSGHTVITIRKTPSVCRINKNEVINNGYMTSLINVLLPALIRAHCSCIVIGDVGSGKTELIKYLAQYIPDIEGIVTVEDTLEMKLDVLYPEKDIISNKIDNHYTAEQSIRDGLRLVIKWLLMSEARGREIKTIMESASTGCKTITSVHCENVWEIPDRILQMVDEADKEKFENDVYTFFDVGVRVSAEISDKGIHRKIDQLCIFDRNNKENKVYMIYDEGLNSLEFPIRLMKKFRHNKEFALLKEIEKLRGTENEKE